MKETALANQDGRTSVRVLTTVMRGLRGRGVPVAVVSGVVAALLGSGELSTGRKTPSRFPALRGEGSNASGGRGGVMLDGQKGR